MTEFWHFWSEHYFLAFFALCFSAWALYGAIMATQFICNRLFRTIKVCARGWPPAHLDADGDWKPSDGDHRA